MSNVIAIIPARSGSKGIKDKCIMELQGKPLIAHSIEVARQSGLFDRIILSTDSHHYAEIGMRYGAEVPFIRDGLLAGDATPMSDVILDVLEKINCDSFMLLQPTSPLRAAEDLLGAYEFFEEKGAEAVVSVTESTPKELIFHLDETKSLSHFNPADAKRRQDLAQSYKLNGSIYLCKKEFFLRNGHFYGPETYAYIMSPLRSLDIDTRDDFRLAELLLDESTTKSL